MGKHFPNSNGRKFTTGLTPEIDTILDELSGLAGISQAAVSRHLMLMGAPVFRAMIKRGVVPPDPLEIWRESVIRGLASRR